MDWRSVKLRPRSSVAVVAMAGNRVDGPSLLATVRLDRIFTADSENAYLFSVNFHGGYNLRLKFCGLVPAELQVYYQSRQRTSSYNIALG